MRVQVLIQKHRLALVKLTIAVLGILFSLTHCQVLRWCCCACLRAADALVMKIKETPKDTGGMATAQTCCIAGSHARTLQRLNILYPRMTLTLRGLAR